MAPEDRSTDVFVPAYKEVCGHVLWQILHAQKQYLINTHHSPGRQK